MLKFIGFEKELVVDLKKDISISKKISNMV